MVLSFGKKIHGFTYGWPYHKKIVYDLRTQNLSFVAPIPEQTGTTTMHFPEVSANFSRNPRPSIPFTDAKSSVGYGWYCNFYRKSRTFHNAKRKKNPAGNPTPSIGGGTDKKWNGPKNCIFTLDMQPLEYPPWKGVPKRYAWGTVFKPRNSALDGTMKIKTGVSE